MLNMSRMQVYDLSIVYKGSPGSGSNFYRWGANWAEWIYNSANGTSAPPPPENSGPRYIKYDNEKQYQLLK